MPIVIDDESDDDLPLFARPRATMPAKREGSSDEEPDWMKSFKSPTAKADDDDSDDGMILDIFQRKPKGDRGEVRDEVHARQDGQVAARGRHEGGERRRQGRR